MARTDRRERILAYIQSYVAERGYPPTIREIGEACNIASTSVVNYNLNKLREGGELRMVLLGDSIMGNTSGSSFELLLMRDYPKCKIVNEIKRQYMHEYVKQWEDFLNDIRLIPSTSLTQSIEVARILSGPDSPLALFLRAAAKETRLIKEASQDRSSLTARAKAEFNATKAEMVSIFGTDAIPLANQPQEPVGAKTPRSDGGGCR